MKINKKIQFSKLSKKNSSSEKNISNRQKYLENTYKSASSKDIKHTTSNVKRLSSNPSRIPKKVEKTQVKPVKISMSNNYSRVGKKFHPKTSKIQFIRNFGNKVKAFISKLVKNIALVWNSSLLNKGLIIFSLLLLLYPYYPEFTYRFDQIFHPDKFENKDVKVFGDSTSVVVVVPTDTENESDFVGSKEEIKDRVIISSIGVDQPIIFGGTDKNLKYGAWMKPNSSTIGTAGNKILTGHRFSFQGGGGPFYHLKKTSEGDEVLLFVKGVYYKYKITEKIIVEDTAVWVENQSDQDILTIYTCEGIKAEKRYVVKAKRI